MTPCTWLILTASILTTVAIWAFLTAPEAYEDETGFHVGRPPSDREGQ